MLDGLNLQFRDEQIQTAKKPKKELLDEWLADDGLIRALDRNADDEECMSVDSDDTDFEREDSEGEDAQLELIAPIPLQRQRG